MKRMLVGLVLLAMCAGGAVAWAQALSPDPLTARILELQNAYRQVVTDIGVLEAQLQELKDHKLRLEGGIMELQRYQAQVPPSPTPVEPKGEDTAAEPN